MGLETEINLPELVNRYLFSNTPRYLYDHFKGEPSVQRLAQTNSPDTLAAAYESFTTKPERTPEDVAAAYAILVAISFVAYDQAVVLFDKLDLSRLDWGEQIKDIFKFTAASTNVFKITVPFPTRIISNQPISATSAVVDTFTIDNQLKG